MSQIAIILLLLCQETVFSSSTSKPSCQDTKSFCNTLTNAQCKLRVAKEYCPESCQSCAELPLPPETPAPDCSDSRTDCKNGFYICGVYPDFEQECKKTCELCPSQQGCQDTKSFCNTLTNAQCGLKVAKQYCPKKCQSCDELPLHPETPAPDCSDSRTDCKNGFYICGVYPHFEKGCSKTCQLCPSDDAMQKCLSKNQQDFCYNLEAVCSVMLGAPLSNLAPGSSHKLPPHVAHCVSSENVMAVCQVKYGSDFCYKLEGACAGINNAPLPQQTPGFEYKLPKQVAACMSKEVVMAVCEAKHGAVQCNTWKEGCTKKPNDTEGLSSEEKECMKTQSVMATCKSKFGDHCVSLEGECTAAYGAPAVLLAENGIYKMPSVVESCVDLGGIMATCISNHNASQCYDWEANCTAAENAPVAILASGSYHKLPPAVASCVLAQDIMEQCQKKLGLQTCYSLDAGCKAKFGEPSALYSAGSLYKLSPQVIGCIVPQI